jgi:hypothetical protein
LRRTRMLRTTSILAATLLTACPQKYSIVLESPGSSGDPSFRFRSGFFGNGGAAVTGIEVRRCSTDGSDSGAVMWAVSYPDRADVKSVHYGHTPEGSSTVTKPSRLGVGCYVVQDPPDRKPLLFHVKASGQAE